MFLPMNVDWSKVTFTIEGDRIIAKENIDVVRFDESLTQLEVWRDTMQGLQDNHEADSQTTFETRQAELNKIIWAITQIQGG